MGRNEGAVGQNEPGYGRKGTAAAFPGLLLQVGAGGIGDLKVEGLVGGVPPAGALDGVAVLSGGAGDLHQEGGALPLRSWMEGAVFADGALFEVVALGRDQRSAFAR